MEPSCLVVDVCLFGINKKKKRKKKAERKKKRRNTKKPVEVENGILAVQCSRRDEEDEDENRSGPESE